MTEPDDPVATAEALVLAAETRVSHLIPMIAALDRDGRELAAHEARKVLELLQQTLAQARHQLGVARRGRDAGQ